MSKRSVNDAVRDFAEPLQRSLTAFAQGNLSVGHVCEGKPLALDFNGAAPTSLKTVPGVPGVSITITLRVVPKNNTVTTLSWAHGVYVNDEERLFFHWHPDVTPQIPFPHVHVDRHEPHIPTGRILVEDVLIAAMEFGALPVAGDWKERFRESAGAFGRSATWGQRAPMAEDWLARWDDQGTVREV